MSAPPTGGVAILVPHGESVRSEFAMSLRALDVPGGSVVIGSTRRPLDFARNHLAREALKTGAAWFLWLDSDMQFPRDTLRRLLAHKRMFVSGLYYTRERDRSRACAYVAAKDAPGEYRAIVPPKEPALVEVDGVGFGCVLTHRSLFEQTGAPWFAFPGREGNEILGEDFFFCEAARAATSVRPFVDTGLHIGHAWSRVVMPSSHDEEMARGGVGSS